MSRHRGHGAGDPIGGDPGTTAGAPGAAAPGAVAAQRRRQRAEAIAGQPRFRIDTPRLHGSIALMGARFDDLTLADYHETVDPKSPEVVLLSPPGTANPYLAEFGWVAANPGSVKVPGPETLWKASGGTADPVEPGDLDLGQWPGAGLHPHDLGRRRLHVHGARRGAQHRQRPGRAAALRPGQPHRDAAGRRLLHFVRRADRLSRRLAAGGQILLAERRTSRSISPPPAAGSASPTNTG